MDPFVESFLALARADPGAPVAIGRPSHCDAGTPASAQGKAMVVDRGTLAERVEALARTLRRHELPPGARVALLAPPGPGFLAGYLALRRAGLCVLLIDPSTPEPERNRVLETLSVGASLTMHTGWSCGESESRFQVLPRTRMGCSPEAAVLKLSSGTTGSPSGIAVEAEALYADHRQLEASMGLNAEDRYLVVVPMSHSYGFSLLPSSTFVRGSVLVFPGMDDPMRVAAEERVSVVPSVPSWYRARLTLGVEDWPAATRLFLCAGAPLLPTLARGWRTSCGRPIHVLYGASECGGICYDRRGDAAERGTVGEAVEGVELQIQAGGANAGRVIVRSAAVGQGYVPEQAAADSQQDARLGAGEFKTSDLGRMRGKELELQCRLDDWINVKGKKVNPREVETVLAAMPGVREVAVLGVALPNGRGQAVHAVIACNEGSLRYRDVLVWCRDRLAPHKVPRGIRFTLEIPRTGRGKPDRGALLELASEAGRTPN